MRGSASVKIGSFASGAIRLVFSLMVLLGAGCATVDDNVYIPTQLGEIPRPTSPSEISLTIYPEAARVERGDLLRFTATLRNAGAKAFYIPQDPVLLFMWTYPNGRRDNMLVEQPTSRHYDPSEVRLIEPGEEVRMTVELKTHYFPKTGITEFVAIYKTPENSNSALASLFGPTRAISNHFGIMVQ